MSSNRIPGPLEVVYVQDAKNALRSAHRVEYHDDDHLGYINVNIATSDANKPVDYDEGHFHHWSDADKIGGRYYCFPEEKAAFEAFLEARRQQKESEGGAPPMKRIEDFKTGNEGTDHVIDRTSEEIKRANKDAKRKQRDAEGKG